MARGFYGVMNSPWPQGLRLSSPALFDNQQDLFGQGQDRTAHGGGSFWGTQNPFWQNLQGGMRGGGGWDRPSSGALSPQFAQGQQDLSGRAPIGQPLGNNPGMGHWPGEATPTGLDQTYTLAQPGLTVMPKPIMPPHVRPSDSGSRDWSGMGAGTGTHGGMGSWSGLGNAGSSGKGLAGNQAPQGPLAGWRRRR